MSDDTLTETLDTFFNGRPAPRTEELGRLRKENERLRTENERLRQRLERMVAAQHPGGAK